MFFLPPHPPSATLFPYTTLFRSHGLAVHGLRRRVQAAAASVPAAARHPAREDRLPRVHPPRPVLRPPRSGVRPVLRDRKSTRLNSSHVEISYAVFCLKKKNKADE